MPTVIGMPVVGMRSGTEESARDAPAEPEPAAARATAAEPAAARATAAEPASAPRWLSASQGRDWRTFLYGSQRLFDALDRDLLRDFGIPLAYYDIFVRLSEAPGRSMRMSDLATATRSSRSRLSHAVARLEESGWVRRVDCETDRRGQLAEMTPAGMALLEQAAPVHLESVRRYLIDPLSAQQLERLGEISRVVYNSIPGGEPLP